MNGPDHYLEAERLAAAYKQALADVAAMPGDTQRERDDKFMETGNARALLDKAQVHAILAAAAATLTAAGRTSPAEVSAWRQAVEPR